MASKSNLREFQRSVAERLRDTSKLRTFASKLGFQVGEENCFVSVPQTKHWFQGVANVRGKLFAVADFSAFQGGAATAQSAERCVVLLSDRFLEASGIMVNRMLGLRNPESFERVDASHAMRPWVKAQYRDPNGVQWFELDVAVLAKSAAFLEVSSLQAVARV
jgi:twitching motility protein PilI